MRLEAFINRFKRKGFEAIPVKDLPVNKIDVTYKHPLYYYPGFKEFTQTWNEHASSEERQVLVALVHDEERPQIPVETTLQDDITAVYNTQIAEAESILLSPAATKSDIKLAKRSRRRARERLRRFTGREEKNSNQDDDVASGDILKIMDRNFILSHASDRYFPAFYAAEFLREDEQEIDILFQEYAARKKQGEFETELELRGLNFSFISIVRYYKKDDVPFDSESENTWRKAGILTERQLKNMNFPPSRF